MYSKPPAISGNQLVKLLKKDGWVDGRKAKHGITLTKSFGNRKRVTLIPNSRAPLDPGTLAAILGPKQTCITKAGFIQLINQYGL